MKLKLVIALLVTSLGVCNSSFAATEDDETTKLIYELSELTGAKEQFSQMLVMVKSQLVQLSERMSKDIVSKIEKEAPEKKEILVKILRESNERWLSEYDRRLTEEVTYEEMLEKITVPVTKSTFTKSEIKQIITFYKSDVGVKLKSTTPKMMQESMQGFQAVFGPRISAIAKEITEAERLRQIEEVNKVKSD